MRQRPNPESKIWEQKFKADTWSQSPDGSFVPPPPPPTMPVEYSDGVDLLYSDSSAVNYV